MQFNKQIKLLENTLSFNLLNFKDKKKRGPLHRRDQAGVFKLTSADPKKVDIVADAYKKKRTPFYQIEMLKGKEKGFMFIDKRTADKIIKFYALDPYIIETGTEKGLSTSGIKIGYHKFRDKYYLSKGMPKRN